MPGLKQDPRPIGRGEMEMFLGRFKVKVVL